MLVRGGRGGDASGLEWREYVFDDFVMWKRVEKRYGSGVYMESNEMLF